MSPISTNRIAAFCRAFEKPETDKHKKFLLVNFSQFRGLQTSRLIQHWCRKTGKDSLIHLALNVEDEISHFSQNFTLQVGSFEKVNLSAL